VERSEVRAGEEVQPGDGVYGEVEGEQLTRQCGVVMFVSQVGLAVKSEAENSEPPVPRGAPVESAAWRMRVRAVVLEMEAGERGTVVNVLLGAEMTPATAWAVWERQERRRVRWRRKRMRGARSM